MAGKPNPPKEYARECTGRPSKFTPERCAAIVDDIAHRVPYEYAAEGNGVSENTLYIWLDIAKQHEAQGIESAYTVFREAIKRAESRRIREHNQNIADHVDKWTGDAWILERRWHKHYSTNAALNELNHKMDRLLETGDKHEKGSHEESSQEND